MPDQVQWPRPEEKLAVNKPNTQNYHGPNLGKARELFNKLDMAQKNVGYTRLQKSFKNFEGSLGSSQFSSPPDRGPKVKYPEYLKAQFFKSLFQL